MKKDLFPYIGNLPLTAVTAPVLLDDLEKQKYEDLMVVSPDVGGVVRARAFAKRLECDLAEFLGPQQWHRRYRDRTGLHHGEPCRDQQQRASDGHGSKAGGVKAERRNRTEHVGRGEQGCRDQYDTDPPDPSTDPPRSFTTTFAPRAASCRQCCRPSPLPPPVTMATLPSNRMVMWVLVRVCGKPMAKRGANGKSRGAAQAAPVRPRRRKTSGCSSIYNRMGLSLDRSASARGEAFRRISQSVRRLQPLAWPV